MCILLKLDYAKFSVSNLFFSKVIEENPFWGVFSTLPLVNEGLRGQLICMICLLGIMTLFLTGLKYMC